MEILFYVLLFIGSLELPLTAACTQERDTTNGICVSRVYCDTVITLDWYRLNFGEPCANLFYWNGYRFGETIYTLKGFTEDEVILRGRTETNIITGLDLSNNDYTQTPQITAMSRLKSLNFSRNALTEAKLYNPYELSQLSELDLSYNTINSILVNNDNYVYRKLKILNLSHNYLVILDDSVFDSFPEIENLDLSFNFIDFLSITTFEGMKNLINLNFKHNRLTDLNSSLFRFSKLTVLDLSENKIQNVKFADFEKLTSLKILDLSNNLISQVQENVWKKNILLQMIYLNNNIIENIGKETFSNMSSIQNVNLSKNRLKSLPKDLFKDKRISIFSITENYLEGSLLKGTFEGLKLVTDLDLGNQQLTSIEDFAFYGLEYLKILMLNNNRLQTITKRAFNLLRSLDALDLSNNQLTIIDFDKDELVSLSSLLLQGNLLFQVRYDYFNSLNSLQMLDLANNNISLIETNSFHSLSGLINLQISNNPIRGTLEKNAFDGLSSLPSIDISGTLLTAIKNGSFSGMTLLKELNASHCNISDLQYNSFIQTGFIGTIDLSYNLLTIFYINTTEMINLEKLILNNNLLTVISSSFLKGLPRLINVIVSHNKIITIDDKGFEDQKDLRHLDLSYNTNLTFSITKLVNSQNLVSLLLSGIQTNITFQPMTNMEISYLEMSYSGISNITSLGLTKIKNLENLALSHNEVVQVEAAAFRGVNNLKDLDLSYNQINFIQPGAFKDSSTLRVLNISHNLLTTVTYGMFRGLLYLETIDMSFNEISDLKSERFYEVQNLITLIADNNKINNIASEDFAGTRLMKLSIGGNPIPCHVIVNLKKISNFAITAVKLDENSHDENIDGITCNRDGSIRQKSGNEVVTKDKILIDIKDILLNMSSKEEYKSLPSNSSNDSKYLSNLINQIVNINSNLSSFLIQANHNTSSLLNKQFSSISQNSNVTNMLLGNTNMLLGNLLKVLATIKSTTSLPMPPLLYPSLPPPTTSKNNTLENPILYINKIKNDLENAMTIERQNIYNEIDNRISNKLVVADRHTETPKVNEKPAQEAFFSRNFDSYSLLFIEVCVGLMLFVMLGLILYKFYNSGMFIPNRYSSSTRHLPDAMENSTL